MSVVPLVSVITEDAARPELLEATARSLRAQTLERWEWIVVGDAAGAVLAGEPRARVLAAGDEALRTGAAASVVVLPAGTELAPTALEQWAWVLATHPTAAAVCSPDAGPDAVGMARRAALAAGDVPAVVLRQDLVRRPAGGAPASMRFRGAGDSAADGAILDGVPHGTVCDEVPFDNPLPAGERPVLVLVSWFIAGGAEKFTRDLVRVLRASGRRVTLVATLAADHAWIDEFRALTPDLFVLPGFLDRQDYPRFLAYLIASRGIETVLVTQSEVGYALLPFLRAAAPGVAVLDYTHIADDWRDGGCARLSLRYHALLDLSVVSSQALAGWLTSRGADPARVAVCTTNIDTSWWRPDPDRRTRTRSELGVDDGVPVLLYAARLCPQKQPRVLAETVLALRRRGVALTALVAGDGPERAWLDGFVRRHDLGGSIRLLGSVPNARMRDLLCAADVFFLPSRNEGISLAFYEAMACGVAVVGADVGGQRELVTPECGVLIAPEDPSADVPRYTDALAALLPASDRLRRMGTAARERVDAGFRLEQMADRMRTLLDEAARLAREEPRALPPPALAPALAEQGVAAVFASELGHRIDPYRAPASLLVYFAVRRVMLPLYEAALGRSWLAVGRVKDAVRRWLVRP